MAKLYSKDRILQKIQYHRRAIEQLEVRLLAVESGRIVQPKNHNDIEKRRYVYALQCHAGYYYVGQTTSVEKRFKQHAKGKGSWFTKVHKPVEVIEVVDAGLITMSDCLHEENILAAKYIFEYGIDRVRGGSFIQKDSKYFIDKLNNYAPVEISYTH